MNAGVESEIARAVAAIKQGKLVAIPTDTVYGIAASLENPDAIEAVYAAKGRDAGKALPILVDGAARIAEYSNEAPDSAFRLANAFWPGALTMVVPASERVPFGVHRGAQTVGLRMPDNPIALAIIQAAGGGLAVTSANLSGRSEARSAGEVRRTLGDRLGFIVNGGRSPDSVPSTVVDLTDRSIRILRQGSITRDDLDRVLSR